MANENKKSFLDHITAEHPGVMFYHWPGQDASGKATKGRLAATIAVKRLADGALAVGISRVHYDPSNPNDPLNEKQPTRLGGQKKAEARVNRFVGLLTGELKAPNKVKNTEGEIKRKLVLKMNDEEFKKTLLEDNPFIKPGCPFGSKIED